MIEIERALCPVDVSELRRSSAADVYAQVTVIGRHPRSAADRLLFGSTTQQVIRQAPCPVLTVGAKGPRERGRPKPAGTEEAGAKR